MYEMTIRLNPEDGGRLYEQIYLHIRKEIVEGKLFAGEKLPSTRSLAEYLQVARSTVDYAYGQLLDEGYIESRPCSGYYVCSVEELTRMEKPASGPEGTVIGGNTVADDLGGKPDFDFSPYDIDLSGFPYSVWKRISRNILTDVNSELLSRGAPQGDYGLRMSICRYLYSSRGVECKPEQIIVGAGNDYLLMLLEKILDHRVKIAMENPTYTRSYRIFHSFSYEVVTVDMDDCGMRVDQLSDSGASIAYVMPSHQFPAGTVMPIGRRLELLKWAYRGADRYIIEDDYDSEFRYHGKPIPALLASDEQGRVIYIGSFSKSIAPAIRVSFMVLPEQLLKKYREECFFYSCTVSRIDQSILNEFISQGYFERHLNKMRKIYRAKHELLLEELKPFRKKYMISGENAGLHLLLTSKEKRGERELVEKALARGVRVYGLSEGMLDGKESNTVLLGFGGLTREQIVGGTVKLKEAWL